MTQEVKIDDYFGPDTYFQYHMLAGFNRYKRFDKFTRDQKANPTRPEQLLSEINEGIDVLKIHNTSRVTTLSEMAKTQIVNLERRKENLNGWYKIDVHDSPSYMEYHIRCVTNEGKKFWEIQGYDKAYQFFTVPAEIDKKIIDEVLNSRPKIHSEEKTGERTPSLGSEPVDGMGSDSKLTLRELRKGLRLKIGESYISLQSHEFALWLLLEGIKGFGCLEKFPRHINVAPFRTDEDYPALPSIRNIPTSEISKAFEVYLLLEEIRTSGHSETLGIVIGHDDKPKIQERNARRF
jgi:hypothetical protein